jgi:anti-sigma factor RsiW
MQGEPEKFPGSAPVLDEISRRQERAFAWQELIFHLRQKAVPAAPEKVPQTEKPQRPRRRRTTPLRRRMAHAQVLDLFTAALQDHIRARQKPR